MVALEQENIWFNKAHCEEAERLYYEKLSRAKDVLLATKTGEDHKRINLSAEVQRAYKLAENSSVMAAVAQEKIWFNKAHCEEAERLYYEKLSGAKNTLLSATAPADGGPVINQSMVVDNLSKDDSMALRGKITALEMENRQLMKDTEDLMNLILKLEHHVAVLEQSEP
jgi:hypothetical protein